MAVADFIIDHAYEAVTMSISELSEKTGVSVATVSRFAKTLFGITFPQLKMMLAQELAGGDSKDNDYTLAVEDDMMIIQMRMARNLDRLFHDTIELNPPNIFTEIAKRIVEAEHIYLFGIGASGLAVQDLSQKLVKLGKSTSFNMDSNLAILNSSLCTERDFVIVISYSGLTKEVLIPAKKAQSAGCPVLSITGAAKNPLQRCADYHLSIPMTESKIIRITAIYSRYGEFFLIDLLFMAVMKELGMSVDELIDRYNDLLLELKV